MREPTTSAATSRSPDSSPVRTSPSALDDVATRDRLSRARRLSLRGPLPRRTRPGGPASLGHERRRRPVTDLRRAARVGAPELSPRVSAPRSSIVGRPNVGKSSLVNRLAGQAQSPSSKSSAASRGTARPSRSSGAASPLTSSTPVGGSRRATRSKTRSPNRPRRRSRAPIWCCWSSTGRPARSRRTPTPRVGCCEADAPCCSSSTRSTTHSTRRAVWEFLGLGAGDPHHA